MVLQWRRWGHVWTTEGECCASQPRSGGSIFKHRATLFKQSIILSLKWNRFNMEARYDFKRSILNNIYSTPSVTMGGVKMEFNFSCVKDWQETLTPFVTTTPQTTSGVMQSWWVDLGCSIQIFRCIALHLPCVYQEGEIYNGNPLLHCNKMGEGPPQITKYVHSLKTLATTYCVLKIILFCQAVLWGTKGMSI